MGVRMSSSCLMMSRKPDAGLLGSSDGSVAERGVLSDGPLRVCPVGVLWGACVVGVLSDGRLGICIDGVFRAGRVGLGEADGMMGSRSPSEPTVSPRE